MGVMTTQPLATPTIVKPVAEENLLTVVESSDSCCGGGACGI